ncbi:MAG: excinuclease ABC subunit UvrA, partial [Clostridia bacterium]|nr:excinuclease ABC subunit UvrA [Clostridia bacterium]
MEKYITIVGARENNLKNVDVRIPRDKLVVFTGLSGSGKTSLAFDTIYAEGYRRFVESLSSYARQFLGQLDKPDVDRIDGLSPAISIDQKTTSRNPRSTVGTVTEIHDYLRLLYARIGIPHCPVCGKEIKGQTVDQIADRILALDEGTRILLLAPVVREKKGRHEKIFSDAQKNGFSRVKVDGELRELDEEIELDKNKKHTVEIVVDRLVIKPGLETRLSGSLETALKLSDGIITVELADLPENDPGKYITMSQNYACEEHNVSIGELSPRMFSFNNPYGACPDCAGLGMKRVISAEKVIPDRSLSLR